MPEDRRQNLAETDRGPHYNQEEWLEEFLDDKGAIYNRVESDDSDYDHESYNENMGAVVHRCSSESVFLIGTLRPATLLKTDSNTGVFL